MRTDPAAVLDALEGGGLAGASSVRLSGLGLGTVPRAIFGLADTLEVLDLSHNALTSLPDDFGRLSRLRALFCSGNRFERLPPVLGDCESLGQIGFRGSGLRDVPAESLPAGLRWLTLTDNALTRLPEELGRRPRLQKLMLAGNRLSSLPQSLADAGALELLRLAANDFSAWPGWLSASPTLAWLALGGNPGEPARRSDTPTIRWSDLRLGGLLGEGASGRVYEAHWIDRGLDVAVKLYKGGMTSDGRPGSEMDAALLAGAHPNLCGAIGRLTGHPEGSPGLVMPRIDAGWRVLAGPPSLETCSRDVYDPMLRLSAETVVRLAVAVGEGAAHLHREGLLHGDLYAHNVIWDGVGGAAVLSDFGAASSLRTSDAAAFQALDVRAFGILLEELTARGANPPAADVSAVAAACLQPDVAMRPTLAAAVDALQSALA